jgi:hypothetical protein
MRIDKSYFLGGFLWLTTTMGATAATLIEYRFDEAGTTAANTGTLGAGGAGTLNGVARVTENQPYAAGSCVEFNGASSYIRVNNTFSYGNQLTIEAWLKPTAVNGQRVIWDDYGNPGVLLAIASGLVQFNVSTPAHPGGGIGVFTGTLATNVWQHVAGVYDGQTMRVFVNGRPAPASAATSGSIIENGSNPAIGSDNDTTTALNYAGRMDDFRIHTHALTANELAGGVFVDLNVARVANQAVTWWRTNVVGYQLRTTTNLASGVWELVAIPPTQVGTNLYVTNTLAGGHRFFRLQSP